MYFACARWRKERKHVSFQHRENPLGEEEDDTGSMRVKFHNLVSHASHRSHDIGNLHVSSRAYLLVAETLLRHSITFCLVARTWLACWRCNRVETWIEEICGREEQVGWITLRSSI